MNFEEITNVSDLVKANEKPNPKEAIHEAITEAVGQEGPGLALEIAAEIVQKLINLHENVATDREEQGDVDGVVSWMMDARTLMTAKALLTSVEL